MERLNNWGEVEQRRHLKKEDLAEYDANGEVTYREVVVTIAGIGQEVLKNDQSEDLRAVLTFTPADKIKPLVLNATNTSILCAAYPAAKSNPEHLVGKQILIWVDPTVSMKGKMVGGLRVRKPPATTSQRDEADELARLKAQIAEMQAKEAQTRKTADDKEAEEFERATQFIMQADSDNEPDPF